MNLLFKVHAETFFNRFWLSPPRQITSCHKATTFRDAHKARRLSTVSADAAPQPAKKFDAVLTRTLLDTVAKHLGIERQEQWYKVSKDMINSIPEGASALKSFGRPLPYLFSEVYPEFDWKVFFFSPLPPFYWSKNENCRKFFDWIAEELDINTTEEWSIKFNIPKLIKEGTIPRLEYLERINEMLMRAYPEYLLPPWLFPYKGLWEDVSTHRKYLDWLAEELGYETQQDWYNITQSVFRAHHGKTLMNYYNSAVPFIVMSNYPEFTWNEWQFENTPKGFWSKQENLSRYVAWVEEQLGIETKEDWYSVKNFDLIALGGVQPLSICGSSLSALLQIVYPEYPWKRWLFVNSPRKFWRQEENVEEYIDWLLSRIEIPGVSPKKYLSFDVLARNRGLSLLMTAGGKMEDVIDRILNSAALKKRETEEGVDYSRESVASYHKKQLELLRVVEEWFHSFKASQPTLQHSQNTPAPLAKHSQ